MATLATISITASTASAAPEPPTKNCIITVTTIRKSDEQSKEFFRYQVATEEDCRKQALEHETNFAPQVVKQKIVKYKWLAQH